MSLTIERLESVCRKAAAIRRTARLQPAGGPGDKVFPPTYEGGVYALEDRVIEGKRVPCALLDSVQSQANRMESALLAAHRAKHLTIPVVTVDFDAAELAEVGPITSLDAPHRLADAILRDSTHGGVGFRQSPIGKVLDTASYANATGLFEVCPTALVFGLWDSAGPRGGLGTKFARALVSEVFAVDATTGVRPSSRIDPLQIQLAAGPLYETADGGWTQNKENARKEGGKPKLVGKEGKPSELNHGNVTPSLGDKGPNHGGVTFTHARQVAVLSLPAIRRLRFPDGSGTTSNARDSAGWTVLAALSLAAIALSSARGLDLRSRCLLVPEAGDPPRLEIVGEDGAVETFTLSADEACALLADAYAKAKAAGLVWRAEGVTLAPKAELVDLVRRSRDLAAKSISEG
jgi:CRISPR-associated protein Csb1